MERLKFFSIFMFILCSESYTKSVSLNTSSPGGPGIGVVTTPNNVQIINNTWHVNPVSQSNGDLAIQMSHEWGFHSEYPSTISLTIDGYTPDRTKLEGEFLMVFAIDTHYFSVVIRLESNTAWKSYPDWLPSPLAYTDNVYFDLIATSGMPRWNRVSNNDAWTSIGAPKLYKASLEWPLHITLTNDPITNTVHYECPVSDRTLFMDFNTSFPTDHGLSVYIMNDASDDKPFDIYSIGVQYTYSTPTPTHSPSTVTVPPTVIPTVSPTIIPTFEPTHTPTSTSMATFSPTNVPSNTPSITPSITPAITPTIALTPHPTVHSMHPALHSTTADNGGIDMMTLFPTSKQTTRPTMNTVIASSSTHYHSFTTNDIEDTIASTSVNTYGDEQVHDMISSQTITKHSEWYAKYLEDESVVYLVIIIILSCCLCNVTLLYLYKHCGCGKSHGNESSLSLDHIDPETLGNHLAQNDIGNHIKVRKIRGRKESSVSVTDLDEDSHDNDSLWDSFEKIYERYSVNNTPMTRKYREHETLNAKRTKTTGLDENDIVTISMPDFFKDTLKSALPNPHGEGTPDLEKLSVTTYDIEGAVQ